MQENAGQCCAACLTNASCNVWSFCDKKLGCGGSKMGQCYLRHHRALNTDKPNGRRDQGGAMPLFIHLILLLGSLCGKRLEPKIFKQVPV